VVIVRLFTTQVGSAPPPSENSSERDPPLTVTVKVLTVNPAASLSTSPARSHRSPSPPCCRGHSHYRPSSG